MAYDRAAYRIKSEKARFNFPHFEGKQAGAFEDLHSSIDAKVDGFYKRLAEAKASSNLEKNQ